MEINLFSFLPLIIIGKGGLSAEGVAKYFLAQVCGSSLFLFCSVLGDERALCVVIIGIGLLVKMGRVPTHYWFPAVLASIRLSMGYLLMT